jgi:hypothetical protein
MAMTGKNRIMIYGLRTDRILAGVLTVASVGGSFLSCWVIGSRWGGATSLACSCCSASASPRCSREKGGHEHNENHFTFRVDTWTPDGESIVESPAALLAT